jgi:ribonuclease-3
MDGGIRAAERFILRVASGDLETVSLQPEEINPKGKLQELLQSLAPSAPVYEILHESGPEHLKSFGCRVVWEGMVLGTGEGHSKKEAEVAAAIHALEGELWLQKTASGLAQG